MKYAMACSRSSWEDPQPCFYFPLHLNWRPPRANSPGSRWRRASHGKRAPAPTHRLSSPLPAPAPCCRNEVVQQPVTLKFSAAAQRRHNILLSWDDNSGTIPDVLSQIFSLSANAVPSSLVALLALLTALRPFPL